MIELSWPDTIHAHFRRVGVRQVGYVPDAGHSRLIACCRDDPNIADVVLTSEEEGIGLLAGAALGGERGVLLMQSSGVGNCINTLSMIQVCSFPLLMLITMRGEWGEFNPWQVPMGTITEDALRLCGFLTYRIDNVQDVDEIVGAGCDMAFDGNLLVAILLSQPGRDFEGGEFVLTEQRPRMQSRAEVVVLRQGDAVAFAVHHRPVQGTRGAYRVNLRHGVSRLRSGYRYTAGVIFHDAK